jgi:hypothetical protein
LQAEAVSATTASKQPTVKHWVFLRSHGKEATSFAALGRRVKNIFEFIPTLSTIST